MGLENDIPWLNSEARRHRYLIGVSGGADSVAMLHILLDAGFSKLVVCHLDHRLRGRASTEDAKFVARLAAKSGLPCESERVDVREEMKCSGESMETAARHARHRFFAMCAVKHRCHKVLLAHHADDQAETVLWNLLRGSHGLKGMRAEQSMQVGETELAIIRPFLGVRHAELVNWLKLRKLPWREDASNGQAVAVRNRLRNEVFPLLNEISGRDAAGAIVRAMADAVEHDNFEQLALEDAKVLDPQGRLHVPTLRKLGPVIQRAAIRRYLLAHGVLSIDRRLLENAVLLLDTSQAAVLNLPGSRRLRRREGRLWITD